MQRKPGFPAGNCSIKMPDNAYSTMNEPTQPEEDTEQRRQQLINFGHAQWGFNNWSWTVTKQELDFVDFANGKFTAGVVAFVSITVKTFDIHRENIGYATALANNKGFAIYKARKCAVTNALRETLLSFGANVATELMDLEPHKSEANITVPESENNQNIQNVPIKPSEPKNLMTIRKEAETKPVNLRSSHPVQPIKNAVVNAVPPVKPGVPLPPPVPAPPLQRHGSNVSYVLQPVMNGIPPMYAPPPRLAPPHPYPNYYDYAPWHYAYEPHGNVNLNFNIPPKNLVVNGRPAPLECKNACGVRQGPVEGEPIQYGQPPNQGCWIKPTIFYDGFWTEQKVKKWVAEQVEKQFPEESSQKSSTPNGHPDCTKS